MSHPASSHGHTRSQTRRAHQWRRLRHFVRTPKGTLTLVLALTTTVAARVEGVGLVAPGLIAAVGAAVAVDLPLLRWTRGRWVFPSGAVLTGLLVGVVLSSFEPLFVPALASVLGIAAKHTLRTRSANIFNPAALGLVAVFHLFDTAQNWWGALPAIVPGAAWPLLACGGGLMAYRVRKLPLVVAFLAGYFSLFALATFVVEPTEVSEVFVAPDLLAVVFCACFILTDPPTSPTRPLPQVACGVLAAAVSVGIFVSRGSADYLLGGILAGNVFEGARRWWAGGARKKA